jgi:hypothetical protein
MSVPRCRNSEPANWTKMWRAKLPWNLNVKPLLLEFPSATMIWLWILWYISGCKICQISTTLWSSEKSSERSDSLNFLLVSSYWFPIGFLLVPIVLVEFSVPFLFCLFCVTSVTRTLGSDGGLKAGPSAIRPGIVTSCGSKIRFFPGNWIMKKSPEIFW